jgi:lysophospholipase L1-like esterase
MTAIASEGGAPAAPGALRYVALGDSYTIGTALQGERDRWPNRLVAALGPTPPALELVANLGVNGYTSGDLIAAELPPLAALRPAFVSVLIGVNDVVQGVSADAYRANVVRILDTLLGSLAAARIVTVATPDYTVTPQGATYGDPAAQAAGIRTNNATLRALAEERAIAFVDIFDLSLRAAGDRTLVADDGLHPSGGQYALWVERIAPVVARLLGRVAEPLDP